MVLEGAELLMLPVELSCEKIHLGNSPLLEDTIQYIWTDGPLMVAE